MKHDLELLESLSIELARSAGEIILEGAREAQHEVGTKSTLVDVVTETDKAAEAHIVSELQVRRPDDAIVGEEGAAVAGTSGVEWFVDPLDGTVNFLYSIPSFSISIGAFVDGRRAVGAVFNPVLDEMYHARVGGGAYCNDVQLQANDTTLLGQTLLATGFSYSADNRTRQAAVLSAVLPHVRDIRRMGSAALDLCNVASGRVDAYYERHVNPWDVAAGAVIATEAGAVVSDLTDGLIVAGCTPAVYDELLTLI